MFKLNIFDSFKATAQYIFDRHAPLKEKHVRLNQITFEIQT